MAIIDFPNDLPPLPENIFKWDVDMIQWLAKKFQTQADETSGDPAGDNQHEVIEIPFQMWGYTGFDIGSSYALASPSATAFSVYQLYIDGGNNNFIENFVDVYFADRDYSGITSANYTRFYEYCQDIQLDFPATVPYNYYYYHFNYPETRHLHYGNSDSGVASLYTYDDNNNYIYNCFSNALSQYNNSYGYISTTTGSYLSLDTVYLHSRGEVNGFPVFSDWFRTSAYYDTLSTRYASIPVAMDLPLFSVGMDNGPYETQYKNTVVNVYNSTNQQTTTYTTEQGDTITIYQGDNNIYIDNDGHGLTYDDLVNVFNTNILPFINENQGTDIVFPTYDEIKYTDMGDFYITPIEQIPKLPDVPDLTEVNVDIGSPLTIIGSSITSLISLYSDFGTSALLAFVFILSVVVSRLRGD